MPGNEALIETICERLRPYMEDADTPEAMAMLESNLRLLDMVGGDTIGQRLGEMLGAVERSITGLEQGNPDAAIAEAERWGVAHIVRAELAKREREGTPIDNAPARTVDNPRAGAVSPTAFSSGPHPPDPAHTLSAPPMPAAFGTDPRQPRFDQFTGEPIGGQPGMLDQAERERQANALQAQADRERSEAAEDRSDTPPVTFGD